MNATASARSRPRQLILAAALVLAVGLPVGVVSTAASAASGITVAAAIAAQDGRTATVTGYVVGEPTATNTVRRSAFTGDTAIAIADSAAETATGRMLYVQVTAAYRGAFGLRTNPGTLGSTVTVTGTLTAYFSHAGLKNPTAFTRGGTTPTPSPTATPGPTPTGNPGSTYYSTAIGKTGPALRSSLHSIIKVQTRLSYAQVWDALKQTDQDPNNANNVLLLYSGTSRSKNSNGGSTGNWNREHVWAQSHGNFGTSAGPGTDVHHLRATDVTVNSTRGNKDFDNGGNPVSSAPGNYTDSDSWEPRDADKGDVARMLFYMAIRYEGNDGWPNLEVNESTSNGSSPYHGKLSVLKQWHQQDPPDAFERRRNQVIFDNWQGNRNPFVDHPEWVSAIWG